MFSCLSSTVLYNSVSLNQDFSSREEKILTATLSPCHCPRQTSPYRPFPKKQKEIKMGLYQQPFTEEKEHQTLKQNSITFNNKRSDDTKKDGLLT